MPRTQEVRLARCSQAAQAYRVLPGLLDASGLWGNRDLHGLRVLVKPNLLRSSPLACTAPEVVASACRWLLARGARVIVADSPGFGSARGVAKAIGLSALLVPMGIDVQPFTAGTGFFLDSGRHICIAREAEESDFVLSVARLKAHSQMLVTLSCKNCYGCVPGLRKAIYHTREGKDPKTFADMQAAILGHLPPLAGIVDGIVAMHVTGPSGGQPYPLGLLGASASPVALDEAVCRVLGLAPEAVPLQAAFLRARHPDCSATGCEHIYPNLRPEDFSCQNFVLPTRLKDTSFHPLRLARSCIRRLLMERFH